MVNPEFDAFWQTYSKDSNLHLTIPEVVKGEILYQQTTSALKQLKKASQSLSEICSITDSKYSLRLTPKRIKQQVEKRFNKWLKLKKADLLSSPVGAINWEDIISNSIWRKAPFEADSKNPDN